ncbi:MAG: hypothetical protein IBX43_02010 [Campylobacterales bacterium]|nr:hypothetical protein [Campylobacterales bacterium]
MKKIITSMLITAGITSSLAAAEKGVYVGIDIGNTSANLKANIPAIGYSESEKDDGGSQTFKMATILTKIAELQYFTKMSMQIPRI